MKIERPKALQKLPENAKTVYKGTIFDVYQWEQEMYNGTKAVFEKLGRPDSAAVISILDDGRILLLEQEQPGKEPFISGVGGRIEDGEDPETAARRELLEETGYEADELILWRAGHQLSKIDWVIYTFIAKGLRKVSEMNLDGGEKIKLKPVTFEEFLRIVPEENFSEKEIIPLVYKALIDPEEMIKLKKLFDPKNA